MKSITKQILCLTGVLCLSMLVFGCSGGSGSSSAGSPIAPQTTVSGSVFAGPATGATVKVKSAAGTVVATSFPSGSDGSFSIAIPTAALANDLIFEASGGKFSDEATAITGVNMGSFSAHVAGGTLTAGANVTLDPSSTILRNMVTGGMTRSAAESAFNTAFGYTPDSSIRPAFCNMSTQTSNRERLAGFRAAAFSRLTMDLGLAPDKQFELLQAMASDLADGVLDGKNINGPVTTSWGPIPEDIRNRFSSALVNYLTSARNKSKLTAEKIGVLPFSKTSLTPSYKVEYVSGMMAAAQGKTSFKIKLTNLSNGAPASGKTVALMPFMHMPTKSHTTPLDPVIDNGDGTYSCTVYFLMASMMNGTSMGFWELKVLIAGAETALFYPPVGMAMGTTPRVTLNGITDTIAPGDKRPYNIFFDGLTPSGGNYTFKLFVSAKESMTSWPGVSPGVQLHDAAGDPWTITTMPIEISTDTINWIPAIDNGNGHWSVAGMTSFVSGVASNVYVRVTVNGEQKTTDGKVVSGANGYQTFIVKP